MPSPKTRRYSIEIKDPDNKPVLFTAVDWTDEERLIAVTQIMRLAGLPDDNWSPGDKPGREVPEPDSLGGQRGFVQGCQWAIADSALKGGARGVALSAVDQRGLFHVDDCAAWPPRTLSLNAC